MRLSRSIVAILFLSVASATAQAAILVSDDFNDNSINAAVWSTNTAIPQGGASVLGQNQRMELTARGHLLTTQQYDPNALGGIRVSGEWTFANTAGGDFLQILTRSDGLPAGGYGETNTGLEFYLPTGGSQQFSLSPRGAISVGNVTKYGTAAINQGDVFNVDIIDGGRSLYARVTNASNPAITTAITGRIVSDSLTSDRVVFHNRESGGRKAYLDNATIESQPYALSGPSVEDDFNDNSLDLTKWVPITAGAPGGANVIEQNGRIELVQRGHLTTFREIDSALVPLRITGRWTFAAPGDQDFFQTIIRSDGLPGGTYGETQNGIEFIVTTGANQQLNIVPRSGAISVGSVVRTGSMPLAAGDSFDFEIIDNRGLLSFMITKVGNPAMTASATAVVTADSFGMNYLAFHNREGGGRVAYLDNLNISTLPEPGSLALLALGALGLIGWFRRRA